MNNQYILTGKLLSLIKNISKTSPTCALLYFIFGKSIEDKIIKLNKGTGDLASSILENFDELKSQINNSQNILEQALLDIEKQQKLFYEEKTKADEYKIFLKINEESILAIDKKYELIAKNNNKFSVILNIIFCIAGAILGNILPPIF